MSIKLHNDASTAGTRHTLNSKGLYHTECKQEETLKTIQGCSYPTTGTKDAMWVEDVYEIQTHSSKNLT